MEVGDQMAFKQTCPATETIARFFELELRWACLVLLAIYKQYSIFYISRQQIEDANNKCEDQSAHKYGTNKFHMTWIYNNMLLKSSTIPCQQEFQFNSERKSTSASTPKYMYPPIWLYLKKPTAKSKYAAALPMVGPLWFSG